MPAHLVACEGCPNAAAAATGWSGWSSITQEQASPVTEQTAPQHRSARRAETSGWAVGLVLFAATMNVATRNYLFQVWALVTHGRELARDRY
jgi:hypothetical protein